MHGHECSAAVPAGQDGVQLGLLISPVDERVDIGRKLTRDGLWTVRCFRRLVEVDVTSDIPGLDDIAG
ncbi:hypothetical protein AB4212_50235, partial [Streptomyces sp. 2MCAF27]